jgi:ketol-acid reductoisomerase
LTGEQPAELISKNSQSWRFEQEYFDNGVLMIAMVSRSRVGFETMTQTGIIESAYYESLHELPLIANTS